MDFYKDQILDHSRFPRNSGTINKPDSQVKENNSSCGDEIDLYLKIDKNNKIKEIKYCCHGCALSTAASSILSEAAVGKTFGQIKEMTNDQVFDLLGMPISKARIGCVSLGLKALQKAVNNYQKGKDMTKNSKIKKITKKSNIAALVAQYPEVGQILMQDYEMHCVGCMAAALDSLEDGARNHGFSDQQIEEMVKHLNKVIKK